MSAFLWLSYLTRSQTGFPGLVQGKSWLLATACPCQAKQRDPRQACHTDFRALNILVHDVR